MSHNVYPAEAHSFADFSSGVQCAAYMLPVIFLCGRPDKPHYRPSPPSVRPSVRPSVCLYRTSPNSKTKRRW